MLPTGQVIAIDHKTVAPASTGETAGAANSGLVMPPDDETRNAPSDAGSDATGPLSPPQPASKGQEVSW